jgi:cytochrome P450 PksS
MFADPDRFDIRRQGNLHLAFGAGPFQCLGAGLARREMEAALAAMVRRLPRLRLDPEYRSRRKPPSLTHRGFASLPVRFS